MPSVRVYDYWEVIDAAGAPHHAGSRSEPIDIPVDGYVDHDIVSLATATDLTLWDSSEAITNFDFFWLKSDQDLKVEVTCDRGNEVGDEKLVFVVTAGTPFRLIYDDALAAYSGTLSGGTADLVDKIAVRNESGATAVIERAIIT